MPTPLTPHAVRCVCVIAECSPPTVRAYLAGRAVRPSVRERIERGLRGCGYDPSVMFGSERSDPDTAGAPPEEEAPRRASGER